MSAPRTANNTKDTHRQPPVDSNEELPLERIHLDELHAPDLGVPRVCCKAVRERLGPAANGSDEEAVNRQAVDGEVIRGQLVNVVEEDEEDARVHVREGGDARQVRMRADGRGGL